MIGGPETVFLAGGGNEVDSKSIDDRFVQTINEKRLNGIGYIPLAQNNEKHQSGLDWLRTIFSSRVGKIEMLDIVSRITVDDLHNIGSVYIGGVDTVRLMTRLREQGFDTVLSQFIRQGGLVYGGSAGAIILGKSLLTAPESSNYNIDDFSGLNLLSGYSIACHYSPEYRDRYVKIAKRINGSIIAISEKSGVLFDGNEFEIIGEKIVDLLNVC